MGEDKEYHKRLVDRFDWRDKTVKQKMEKLINDNKVKPI